MKNKGSSTFDELKRQLKNLEKDIQVKRYDYSSNETNKAISKTLDAEFTHRTHLFRAFGKGKKFQKANDWDYLVFKRRKQAVRNMMELADERFSAKYPEMCVADEIINLCLPGVALTFNGLNGRFYIEMAAAIWILDYLKNNDRYEEAKQLFPKTREELDQIYLPNISDALHSDDAIRSVIHIIQNRNRGMVGFDEEKSFMDEADTRLKDSPDSVNLPHRKKYDALISLIDTDTVANLEEQFEKYTWNFIDNILGIVHGYRKQEQKARRKIHRLLKSQINNVENASKQFFSPLMVGINTEGELDFLFDMHDSAQQLREADEELGECEAKANSLYRLILLLPGLVKDKLDDTLDEEIMSQLRPIEVTQPFEMCFAFLSLLDHNSDIVWTYNAAYVIMFVVCHELPWGESECVDRDWGMGIDRGEEFVEMSLDNPVENPISKAEDTLFERQYPSPFNEEEYPENAEHLSLAQLAFTVSGIIPPRYNAILSHEKQLLLKEGFSEDKVNLLIEYLSLAYSITQRDSDYRVLDEEIDIEEPVENTENNISDEQEKKLKSEIKRLNNLVHQLDKQNKEQAERLSRYEQELKESNAELAELRSMIHPASETQEKERLKVQFPYSAKSRAVIVGGHETWAKAIKPLLKNVRFIDLHEQPNASLIANAEVVWIQSNAIAHKHYYKVMDIVRKYNIRVCYFQFASAEKCAEQFAMDDIPTQ